MCSVLTHACCASSWCLRFSSQISSCTHQMQTPASQSNADSLAEARRTKAAIRRGDAAAVFRGGEKKEEDLVRRVTTDTASKLNNLVMRLDPENRGGRLCWCLCVSSTAINGHRTLLMCQSEDIRVRDQSDWAACVVTHLPCCASASLASSRL